MLESTITLLATAITNPWIKSKSMRETYVRASGSAYQPSPLLQRLRPYFHLTHKFGFTLLSHWA
jgi:hypothetical protein